MKRIEDSPLVLTGGGTETYLMFIQQFPLREFCAFEIFEHDDELAMLETAMLAPIADAALEHGHDLLFDAMTWRASADYVVKLGRPASDVDAINRLAVSRTRAFFASWRQRHPGANIGLFVNGDIGPRGDGYQFEGALSVASALDYHRVQIDALARAGVDVVSGLTMTNVNEAIGVALAAREAGTPCIISPTVETDGRMPDGTALGELIDAVEDATSGSPLYYMVNCAHPVHLEPVLRRARDRGEPWLDRLRGFRANASMKSHAELDESTEIDRGCPEALGSQLAHLQADFDLCVVGGCCGTDVDHLRAIAEGTGAQTAELAS